MNLPIYALVIIFVVGVFNGIAIMAGFLSYRFNKMIAGMTDHKKMICACKED